MGAMQQHDPNTMDVNINVTIVNDSLEPIWCSQHRWRRQMHLVNSVEKRFYNNVLLTLRWRTSSTPTSDWECYPTRGMRQLIGGINREHLTPHQNNRGCITQRFSAQFLRGNQQKLTSALTSASTSTCKRRTSASSAASFFDNSFRMENSTYNRD